VLPDQPGSKLLGTVDLTTPVLVVGEIERQSTCRRSFRSRLLEDPRDGPVCVACVDHRQLVACALIDRNPQQFGPEACKLERLFGLEVVHARVDRHVRLDPNGAQISSARP
jgi:hypothetical protein